MEDEDIFVYKQVSSWDTDDVIKWMNGLHKCLEQHIPQFLAHCICGSDLLKMSHQQLEYLKVTQVGHQELLLEAVELLSALEKARTHDFTFSLASNLSKKTSQLINALTPSSSSSSSRRSHLSSEDLEANAILSRVETTSAVMVAAKLLLSWLDRNPSNLLEDYDSFRTEILKSALDLASILMDSYDLSQMLEACRAILKCTAVMMCPQNLSSVEPIKLLTVKLQPREESGLGFSIQRTRQGNLVVNNVISGSPASRSGKIFVGVEIVQINNKNVVGWEISKVIETLKASGHEVCLVINAGSSSKEETPDSTTEPLKDDAVLIENGSDDSVLTKAHHPGPSQHDESCDFPSPPKQNSSEPLTNTSQPSLTSHTDNQNSGEPLTNTSQSTNQSDGLSSSQDTLDDIAESPASFEGDTDFSGMENILVKRRLPLDLHRTSSAPLTDKEKDVVLESSTDSYPSPPSSSSGGRSQGGKGKSASVTMEMGSLECIDGAGVPSGAGGIDGSNKSYEARLQQMRTSSDGSVSNKKKTEKRPMPPVAYLTQVIGGVVVRIPIKPEEQEKSNQKRQRNSRQRARNKKTVVSGGKTGAGEGVCEGGGVGEATTTAAAEDHTPADDDGVTDKGRAVFSECKEVTIGGQTTKQVTVSSSTEIVGGSKKASNPALMVPCFQLKNADKEGFMCKMGGSGLTPKNWRRRWFVLKDKKLYYYKTAFDVSALGIVDVVGYTMEQYPESKKKHAFKAVRQGARTYYFQAESADDITSWMECLSEATKPDDQHGLADTSLTIEASDDEL